MRLRRALEIGLVCVTLASALVAAANAIVLRGGRTAEGHAIDPVDCALVLGAGLMPDGRPSGVLEDRLATALALYESGQAKKLIVSGDHAHVEYDEPNAMRAWLEARGVPSSAIFLDHAGFDTYSSVWRAKNVFGVDRGKRGCPPFVVTQRFHLPRALWVARSIGLDAEGIIADRQVYAARNWFEAREVIARTKSLVDVVVNRSPHHRGPRISLDDDGGTATAG